MAQGIKIGLDNTSIEKVKADLQRLITELHSMTDKSPLEIKINAHEIDKVTASIAHLSDVLKTLGGAENVAKATEALKKTGTVATESSKHVEQLETTMGKFKEFNGFKGYDNISEHMKTISSSVDQYDKLVIDVDNKTRQITGATVSYLDKTGRKIKEVMTLTHQEAMVGGAKVQLPPMMEVSKTQLSETFSKTTKELEKMQATLLKAKEQLNGLKFYNADKEIKSIERLQKEVDTLIVKSKNAGSIDGGILDGLSSKVDNKSGGSNDIKVEELRKEKALIDSIFDKQQKLFKLEIERLNAGEKRTNQIDKESYSLEKQLNSSLDFHSELYGSRATRGVESKLNKNEDEHDALMLAKETNKVDAQDLKIKNEIEAVNKNINSTTNDYVDKLKNLENSKGEFLNADELANFNTQLKALSTSGITDIKTLNQATERLTVSFKELKTNAGISETAFNELAKYKNIQAELKLKAEEYIAKLSILEHKHKGAFPKGEVEAFKNSLQQLKVAGDSEIKSTEQRNLKYKELEVTLKRLNAESIKNGIQNRQSDGMSTMAVLGQKAQSLGMLMPIYSGYQMIFDGIRNGVKDVISLDSALTELRITLDATEEQYQAMGDTAMEMSMDMATPVDNILQIIRVYANLNESLDSVKDKIAGTVALANLSGLDGEEITDVMQGIREQFAMTGDDVVADTNRISDSMVAVSSNLALDFAKGIREISSGIQVSGSMAEEAGFSLERYESVLGTVVEKTRLSGSQIGNGMKTVIARLGRVKDLELADDEAISVSEKAYKSIGIALRGEDGQFKDIPEVLDELSGKWEKMSNVQRSYIAEVSAGVRQKNIFLSTMNSWTESTELNTKAVNSNGLAMEKQGLYAESIEGRLNTLKATVTSMWDKALGSNDVKMFVSALTTLVQAISKVTDSFGIWGTLGIALVDVIGFKLFQSLIKTGAETKALSVATATLSDVQKAEALASGLMEGSTIATTTAMKAEAFTIGGLTMSYRALSVAISAVAFGLPIIMMAIGYMVDYNDKKMERASATLDEIKTQGDEIDSLNVLVGKKEALEKADADLQKQQAEGKDVTEKLTKAQADLLQVKKDIALQSPESTSKYTEENEAIAEDTKTIKENIKAKTEEKNNSALQVKNSLEGQMKGTASALKKAKVERDKLIKDYNSGKLISSKVDPSQATGNSLMKSDEYAEKLAKLNNVVKDSQSAIEKYNSAVQELNKTGEYSVSTIDANGNRMVDFANVMDKNAYAIKNTTQAEVDNRVSIIELYNEYMQLTQTGGDATEQANKLAGMISGLSTATDENGKVTITNMGLLNDEIFVMGDEELSVESLMNAKILSAKNACKMQDGETEVTYKQVGARIKMYQDEINALIGLQKSQAVVANTEWITSNALLNDKAYVGAEGQSWNEALTGSAGMSDFAKAQAQAKIDSANSAISELQAFQNEVDGYYASLEAPTSSKAPDADTGKGVDVTSSGDKDKDKSGSGGSKEAQAPANWIDVDRYRTINSQIEQSNNLLAQRNALESSVDEKDNLENSIHLRGQEVFILQNALKTTTQLVNMKRQERAEVANSIARQGGWFTGSGDSLSLQNAQQMLQAKADQLNAHRYDTDRAYYDQLQAQYDNLTSDIERFLDIQTNQIPNAIAEWNNLSNQIAETIQEVKDLYAEDISTYIDEQIKIIEERNDAEDEAIERLEKQNDLIKLQTELQEIQKNENVQLLKQMADGTWDYDYTFNQQDYNDKQTEINDAQKDYTDWESGLAEDKFIKGLQEIQKVLTDGDSVETALFEKLYGFSAEGNTILDTINKNIKDMNTAVKGVSDGWYDLSANGELVGNTGWKQSDTGNWQYYENGRVKYFDDGGIANGLGMMPKDTIEPERVLNPQQTRAFDKLAFSGVLEKLVDFIPAFDSLETRKLGAVERAVKITNHYSIDKVEFPNFSANDEINSFFDGLTTFCNQKSS